VVQRCFPPGRRFVVTPDAQWFCCISVLLASPPQARDHGQSMNDVTQLLSALGQGDPHAASRLLPLVYDEQRRLVAQRIRGWTSSLATLPQDHGHDRELGVELEDEHHETHIGRRPSGDTDVGVSRRCRSD
jgi:ECF sigma factor